jgi:hypothetical protein
MNEAYYFLDAVSLFKMRPAELRSDFVRKNCAIPEEILYEIRHHRQVSELSRLEASISVHILRKLTSLMCSLPLDTEIVDLFHNQGNGDVLLLASALTLQEHEMALPRLFPVDLVIVTDDDLLKIEAAKNSIKSISTNEFILLVQSSM